ncbi:prolyl 3-hydroxylase OGFOD1 [Lingula anatina]|uniref:uS12 prolyl 3-hydroxylase n=1 Tax=Lingula anatina TaxID=7574 RepID=A0A1S3J992_LINAN|nr:prolyl 3-hydroxylase OGFOD1 [Lingula anatina]|eukprot:XP_013406972.1 prolyl 3-hydroxylase OGFOD1 [Lingula anatina]
MASVLPIVDSESKHDGILEQVWQRIVGSSEQAMTLLPDIIDCYSESHRHYHTIHHIINMLKLWSSHQQHLKQPLLVALAVIFHDVIYDPKRDDNEERSAEFFKKFAREMRLPSEESELVSGWIVLTKSHKTPVHATPGFYGKEDWHYLLDFDMAVLGWPDEDYEKYSDQIRQEYIHIPSEHFNSRRVQVLQSFLQIPNIYATKEFRDKFEVQARKNIQEEIRRLQNSLLKGEAILHATPFSCCVLPKFIQDPGNFLETLKDELLDQVFYQKNNDLYKFQQSNDLKKIHTPCVKMLCQFLYGDVLQWMREVTGIPLTDKVDLTCSRYDDTDVLLCHDDELDSRRIAFILYLVPPWKQSDGGALDLFDMDEHGQPKTVVKSVLPAWNNFAFFEVTPASFHQVAEVLTSDKTRLSVNGWFHGPTVPRSAPPYDELPRPLQKYVSVPEEFLYEWINPIYLDMEVQAEIQEKFENESEIQLQDFLKEEKYNAVMAALRTDSVKWNLQNSPLKRKYHSANEENLPEILKQCLTFFSSEAMFLILSNLTGLTLHRLANYNDNSDAVADRDENTKNMEESATKDNIASIKGKSQKDSFGGCQSSNDSDASDNNSAKRQKLDPDKETQATGNKIACSTDRVAQAEKRYPDDECFTGNPRCRVEVRSWSHGCYTLMHDIDAEKSDYALDAMLFYNCKGWKQEYGGYTSYVAKGEDEELLTVNPMENCLALVYRDKDTMRFVKHINHKIQEMPDGSVYYDISAVYYE